MFFVQNMSMFESELENLLGEFHIKMKGELRMTKHPANKWEILFFLVLILTTYGRLCVCWILMFESVFAAWQVWRALRGCVQVTSMR